MTNEHALRGFETWIHCIDCVASLPAQARAEGALEGGQIVDQDTDVERRDMGNVEEEVATTTTTRRVSGLHPVCIS